MQANVQHETVLDSAQHKLGDVYAKALLGATEKAGVTEASLDQLDSLIDDVLDKLPKLDAVLQSPRVPHGHKEQLLDRAFRGKITPPLLNFLKVVSKHGRFDCLRTIRRAAGQLLNELRDRVVANVRTATPLDGATRSAILQRLQALLGKQVVLRERVDPELIGGLVVRVNDTVFDGSVANTLGRMRREAVERASREIRGDGDRFAPTE